jgi:hypothetical protein
MQVDVEAAERFVHANARLLGRHRLAVLLHRAPVALVLDALRVYRNPDGGFVHALEPDVRSPESEPAATFHALEVLVELDALDDPMVADAAAWTASIADPDGGVPFVLPFVAAHPHAPWMVPSDGGSHLTCAIAGALWEAGSSEPWLHAASGWCWAKLARPEELSAYFVKFALEFLDMVPDDARARTAIDDLRARIGPDGSVSVPGGTANERLTPLTLSPRPGARSRTLFTDDQINADLDRLERGQQDDGGWTFDWLAWSPGQSVEWRGLMTLRALATLGSTRAHRPPARRLSSIRAATRAAVQSRDAREAGARRAPCCVSRRAVSGAWPTSPAKPDASRRAIMGRPAGRAPDVTWTLLSTYMVVKSVHVAVVRT